mmetsp:Transcript_44625/g.70673  ORF Transcript_44625/g.70673 Transcript_44625/m.70673 type:complete len:876 (+) Transcript_44625:84-2711(+)
MAIQIVKLVVCIFLAATCSVQAGSTNGSNASKTVLIRNRVAIDEIAGSDIESVQYVFVRSETSHQQSMDSILKSLSLQQAVDILDRNNMSNPSLKQITNLLLHDGKHNLRKQPSGYSGVDGARKLLNDMIFESASKYDAEVAKCTEYYSEQCAAMEVCRGQIAAANYIAANSRALILDAQATINRCEVDIPTRKYELKQHELKCKSELFKLRSRLSIILGDIAVMTTILEMTDCEKSLVQMTNLALLHCTDVCTNNTFFSFNENALEAKMRQLQSVLSHTLMQETLVDLFDGIESMQTIEFTQTGAIQMPVINKTEFNNPPVPMTKVPPNPCTDPNAGAPSAADKRAAKCTIKKSPQCYKLQSRFLLIQAGIEDERDELLEEISTLEHYCEETKKTLQTEIQNDEDMLSNSQTKLAAATEKEANAGEIARQTNAKNAQLNADLLKQMKACSGNYINFETELCALKKIRGELYKLKGDGHAGFFQDCEVSKWDPEECTKKCGGGEQKLTRSVLTHPDGGSKCLPLAALRSCNNQPCPVDCALATWSGWSKCSAECGGGVMQRVREVKTAMRYGGKPCSSTSESKSCHVSACEKDCELSDWTGWSTCSKDCDGGTRKRMKFIKKEAEGAGKCANEWSLKRLQYQECNMKRCQVIDPVVHSLECNKTLDVVLLLDGSGSMGKDGWAAEIIAAKTFIEAFKASGKAEMAVVLFSGPRTWSGVSKCTGKNGASVSLDKCGIKTVTHMTADLDKVEQLVSGLEWPHGSTLTSLALMTAKAEMSLGRADEKTIVVVFTDGRPLSYRKTGLASRTIRKAARLVWVPITKFAPLKQVKEWATRRWQENVIPVKDFKEMHDPVVVTRIIADICPKHESEMAFTRR